MLIVDGKAFLDGPPADPPRLPVTFPLLLAFGDADADVPPEVVRGYAAAAESAAVQTAAGTTATATVFLGKK